MKKRQIELNNGGGGKALPVLVALSLVSSACDSTMLTDESLSEKWENLDLNPIPSWIPWVGDITEEERLANVCIARSSAMGECDPVRVYDSLSAERKNACMQIIDEDEFEDCKVSSVEAVDILRCEIDVRNKCRAVAVLENKSVLEDDKSDELESFLSICNYADARDGAGIIGYKAFGLYGGPEKLESVPFPEGDAYFTVTANLRDKIGGIKVQGNALPFIEIKVKDSDGAKLTTVVCDNEAKQLLAGMDHEMTLSPIGLNENSLGAYQNFVGGKSSAVCSLDLTEKNQRFIAGTGQVIVQGKGNLRMVETNGRLTVVNCK